MGYSLGERGETGKRRIIYILYVGGTCLPVHWHLDYV
jgi:hypothetical protein